MADERGFLERIYCEEELQSLLSVRPLRQVNRSLTLKSGTVRGMHYQLSPCEDAKIVTCTKGSVIDIVDFTKLLKMKN
jgi:dTDP-4-dehydrorhamnose 3,5-epimerase